MNLYKRSHAITGKFFSKLFFLLVIVFGFTLLATCAGQSDQEIGMTQTAVVRESSSPTPAFTDTPVPTSTNTSKPAQTPTVTITPSPTPRKLIATEYPMYAIPFGVPVEVWSGIPIIPDTVHGQEVYGQYWYSVEKSMAEVQEFYLHELGLINYVLSGFVETDTSMRMLFNNDQDQISITVFKIDMEYEKIDEDIDDGKFKVQFEIPEFHGTYVLIEQLTLDEIVE